MGMLSAQITESLHYVKTCMALQQLLTPSSRAGAGTTAAGAALANR
jgi:hypothetical protein